MATDEVTPEVSKAFDDLMAHAQEHSPLRSAEALIERLDLYADIYGRARVSELLASVTVPDDLSESVQANVRRARAGGQRISDNSLKCLVLYEHGVFTHKRYVDLAHCFCDVEGITPLYLRRINTPDR